MLANASAAVTVDVAVSVAVYRVYPAMGKCWGILN